MTLGQRIQELRKRRGLSQEALGEALGVSRQAVSKWEGDNGIPELDTLIALSRFFGVTLGQLLGVEESVGQSSQPEPDREDPVEAALRRYAEQTAPQPRDNRLRSWGRVAEVVAVTAVFMGMMSMLISLRSTVRLLQRELSELRVNVSNSQNALPGQIIGTIHEVLAEEANLLSSFEWELVDFDWEAQTVTVGLNASLKEYTPGSRLQFGADWQKTDGTEGSTTGDWVEGPGFQSEITLPMNYHTELRVRIEDAEGNVKEQGIQTPIYELHPDDFHLTARNLTAPFAISTKTMGVLTETAKAEQADIVIESGYPGFFWPEAAELSASVNGGEVMREKLTIAPDGTAFYAALSGTYFDVALSEGDTLEIVLEVMDNLGRMERYTATVCVENGEAVFHSGE